MKQSFACLHPAGAAPKRAVAQFALLADWKAFRVDEEQLLLSIASRCGGLIAVKAPQCSAALQVDMLLRGIL